MTRDQIKQLSDAGIFDNKPLKGKLIETHISWIILSGKFAFKIKKPLQLSFLDFKSLKNRKHFCLKEVSLNSRFSSIYLDVIPVREHEKHLYLGDGPGKTIDYCVQMKRLQENKRMDKMLAAKNVGNDDIVRLARKLTAVHNDAPVISRSFSLSEAKSTFNDIRSIIRLSDQHLGPAYSDIVTASILWSNQFLSNHSRRIKERIAAGLFRDVHGDLHTANVFLYRDPVLFDCIEFNDRFRQIDVLDELAFLCMDLEANGASRQVTRLVKTYRENLECIFSKEDKLLFNYYKCCRANVRAKVSAVGATQAQDGATYEQTVYAWKKYLRLMKKYINQRF